ncbi:MAG: thiamine phosphate synthase [Acidobacteria bacterium]|nr:MAG: thiamine phosphate synthase [Acidobacteriota bacterium]
MEFWIYFWQSAGSVRARGLIVSRLNSAISGLLLCYLTDRHSLSGIESGGAQQTLLRKIGTATAAGVDWLQIREKDLSGRDSGLLTRKALQLAARSPASDAVPTRILVNDRQDVALSERAGGVHLGENSLPLAEAKRLVKAQAQSLDFLIGISCHSLEAARSAASGGADYLFFGPIFATPSKAAFGAPQGLERLAEVCRAVAIPVLAIGGITLGNASACLAAGASGIAAIRLFQDAEDMTSVVQFLRKLSR